MSLVLTPDSYPQAKQRGRSLDWRCLCQTCIALIHTLVWHNIKQNCAHDRDLSVLECFIWDKCGSRRYGARQAILDSLSAHSLAFIVASLVVVNTLPQWSSTIDCLIKIEFETASHRMGFIHVGDERWVSTMNLSQQPTPANISVIIRSFKIFFSQETPSVLK